MMFLRLALRELKKAGSKLVAVFFILVVGFLGPLFSSALKSSVDTYIGLRSRQMLSADIAVSSLRELTPEEDKSLLDLTKATRTTNELEFMTMARGRDVSTLVEVRGVAEGFPLSGEFQFEDKSKTSSAAPLLAAPIAWVFPEALAQLGLAVGDEVAIGQTKFEIAAVVIDGPGTSRGVGFAPKMYIGLPFVKMTGLTQFGSQVYRRKYIELPKGMDVPSTAAKIKETLADPDIFLRTPADSMASLERFFGFYNLYLVSISMIVFALSWVSAFYIIQVFLQERLKNAGVLMTFGASREASGLVSLAEVMIVMIFSLVVAAVIVVGMVALAPLAFGSLFPIGFVLRLGLGDIARMFAITVVSAIAFAMPVSIRLRVSTLQDLLSETAGGVGRMTRRQAILSYAPLVLVFVLLSIWLMRSWQQALQLTGGVFAALLVGWLLARVVFRALFAMRKNTPGFARLVLLQLARSRFGVNLCFVTLVLGTLVLNLVPHLLKSAVAEIEPIQGKEIPALFLFNVPEAVAPQLGSFATERGAEIRFLSPMILARLMKVNGESTRDDGFQRFPVRLSYREKPILSEKITSGEAFKGPFDPTTSSLPEISMEENFADRNGFGIGDRFEFDVQGVPVEGRVTSLRTVKWTDFNPNFFMVFQPGVLDDAPKTFIANVNIAAGEQREQLKSKFQYDLVRDFPDMNVIDISRSLERAMEIVRSILGPVRAAAWIAVAMTFLILLGVIAHNLRLRTREIEIQKLLGADAGLIRRLISAEYFVLSLVASVLGAGFSIAMTLIVSLGILDLPAKIDYGAFAISVVLTVLVTTAIANVSARRVLGLRGTTRRL
ncbi:MAG: FtsX-like permease family protein [Bdellovibrionota bacterium]